MAAKALQGWKEIAAYLGRGVRTIQRWEQFGLPIHRPAGRDRSAVFALPSEIDAWLSRAPAAAMAASNGDFRYRILVVDDEPAILQTAKPILESQGYEVGLAEDGFDALNHLTRGVPDIIITDLRMPNMSGFELLSVVRKRFPEIGVIAVSGEFVPAVPTESLLADAFIAKGGSPRELFARILELLGQAPIRPRLKRCEEAAVWIARSKQDYIVVTCPYCLRTSPTNQPRGNDVQRIECPHCGKHVTFRMVPGPELIGESSRGVTEVEQGRKSQNA